MLMEIVFKSVCFSLYMISSFRSIPFVTSPQLKPKETAYCMISIRSCRISGSPPETLIIICDASYRSAICRNTQHISSFDSSFEQSISPHRLPQNSQYALQRSVDSQNKIRSGNLLFFIFRPLQIKPLIEQSHQK